MKTRPLFIIIIAGIMLSSCAPAYVPNVINSPMFTEKGDVSISGYSGTSGVDAHLAGAITNHVGLMLNGSFDDHTNDSTDSFHKHQFLEFAPGYFTKINRFSVFEIYGGYGFGEIESQYDGSIFYSYTKADFSRYFLQPGIGFVNNFVNLGVSTRFAYVTIKQNDLTESAFFIEPALSAKFGYKWVMFCGQFGFAYPFDSENVGFEYEPFIFSLGLQVNLGRIIKRN